jgi:hypothetical protein
MTVRVAIDYQHAFTRANLPYGSAHFRQRRRRRPAFKPPHQIGILYGCGNVFSQSICDGTRQDIDSCDSY